MHGHTNIKNTIHLITCSFFCIDRFPENCVVSAQGFFFPLLYGSET